MLRFLSRTLEPPCNLGPAPPPIGSAPSLPDKESDMDRDDERLAAINLVVAANLAVWTALAFYVVALRAFALAAG